MCLCSNAQISSECGFRAWSKIHQPAQRSARVDDVFDQQDVLSFELGFRIVQQADDCRSRSCGRRSSTRPGNRPGADD